MTALGDRPRKWLAEKAEIPSSTVSDAIIAGISKAETAVAIARGLGVSLDWLLTGRESVVAGLGPADMSQIDLVELPEFDLRHMDNSGKGEAKASMLFRRDWLNRTFGTDKALWLTALPSDYPPLGLNEGDQVICRDVTREELHERNLCIWRMPLTNQLLVARSTTVHRGNAVLVEESGEYWVNPWLLEGDDRHSQGADLVVVGRIVGRPLTPIR